MTCCLMRLWCVSVMDVLDQWRLDTHLDVLSSTVDVHELIPLLLDAGVLDAIDVASITGEVTAAGAVRRLVEIIKEKPGFSFIAFCHFISEPYPDLPALLQSVSPGAPQRLYIWVSTSQYYETTYGCDFGVSAANRRNPVEIRLVRSPTSLHNTSPGVFKPSFLRDPLFCHLIGS